MKTTTCTCRICGGPIIFRRWAHHPVTKKLIYGDPVLVIHTEGSCCNPAQLELDLS